jgi:hypothetical protein
MTATWDLDPVALALEASAAMPDSKPDALCAEIGERLLLAVLDFNRWVLRRVEKIDFVRERSVSRRLTIEFLVPDEAPVFHTERGDFWLVPLSIMRRRTLVDLDIRAEDGEPISTPGIRLTQQLDISVLMAAALTRGPSGLRPGEEGREFIREAVTGDKKTVFDAYHRFERPTVDLEELQRNRLFVETLHRLRHNFVLYLLVPVTKKRHRLLRMSFEEPTALRYETADLYEHRDPPAGLRSETGAGVDSAGRVHRYQPGASTDRRAGFLSAIGLSTTKFRFQVPSAEYAASYHFEARAPEGLRIVRASLVAGRPNDPLRHVSADHWEGTSSTVGLHATEIPSGSLCRAELEFRLPTAGWLTTMVVAHLRGARLGHLPLDHRSRSDLDERSGDQRVRPAHQRRRGSRDVPRAGVQGAHGVAAGVDACPRPDRGRPADRHGGVHRLLHRRSATRPTAVATGGLVGQLRRRSGDQPLRELRVVAVQAGRSAGEVGGFARTPRSTGADPDVVARRAEGQPLGHDPLPDRARTGRRAGLRRRHGEVRVPRAGHRRAVGRGVARLVRHHGRQPLQRRRLRQSAGGGRVGQRMPLPGDQVRG